jgi:FixJ family two-component response regulator
MLWESIEIRPRASKPKYYVSDTPTPRMLTSVGASMHGVSSPRKSRPTLVAVVDDDASIRVATDSLLRSRGYAVCTFASAGDFLKSASLDRTGCVITDVRMPVMGGIELQATLRAQGCTIPFVFITAFPEGAVRAQAMNGGATCFLTKPFDAPTLIQYVEAALGTRRDPTPP